MDLMGPYVKSHPEGYTFLLVVTDDFTKWVEIFPLRDATTARKVLEGNVLCRFFMPKYLFSVGNQTTSYVSLPSSVQLNRAR
jgi:hypothetical protein